jgi:hypothetical protein
MKGMDVMSDGVSLYPFWYDILYVVAGIALFILLVKIGDVTTKYALKHRRRDKDS